MVQMGNETEVPFDRKLRIPLSKQYLSEPATCGSDGPLTNDRNTFTMTFSSPG